MNAWWKIGLFAAVVLSSGFAGWHGHTIWDEAHQAKVEAAEIEDHTKTEAVNNQAATDYEKKKSTMEAQIYVLQKALSDAQRKAPAPCVVPGDIVRSVNEALTD